jgi:hypothetical protein
MPEEEKIKTPDYIVYLIHPTPKCLAVKGSAPYIMASYTVPGRKIDEYIAWNEGTEVFVAAKVVAINMATAEGRFYGVSCTCGKQLELQATPC